MQNDKIKKGNLELFLVANLAFITQSIAQWRVDVVWMQLLKSGNLIRLIYTHFAEKYFCASFQKGSKPREFLLAC